MIKFYGLNWRKGSGDYNLFGYFFNGDGSGKGIISQHFFYSSTGNGWGDGDGYNFGYLNGNGYSSDSKVLKDGFQYD